MENSQPPSTEKWKIFIIILLSLSIFILFVFALSYMFSTCDSDSTEENFSNEDNKPYVSGRFIKIENNIPITDKNTSDIYGDYVPLNIGGIIVNTVQSPDENIIQVGKKGKIASFTGGQMDSFKWNNILSGVKDKKIFGHSQIPNNEKPSVIIDLENTEDISKIILINRTNGNGTRIYNSTITILDENNKIVYGPSNKVWGFPMKFSETDYRWKQEDDIIENTPVYFILNLSGKDFQPSYSI